MFYLIGAAHRAQVIKHGEEYTEAHGAFTRCLNRVIEEFHPAMIAEELSEEILKRYGQKSIAKEIADTRKIPHRFCDPDDRERDGIGYKDRLALGLELSRSTWGLSSVDLDARAGAIEIARFFPMRERFWLERLGGFYEQEIAFVCGDFHVDGFAKLVASKGIAYRVIERGIGANAEDERRMNIAVEYLKAHPEILKE